MTASVADGVDSAVAEIAAPGGSDGADTFRFAGGKITSGVKTDAVFGIDFGDGDTFVLSQYDGGTFRDHSGGNVVWNNAAGTYVVIN